MPEDDDQLPAGIEKLRGRYLRLTRVELPAAARDGGWVVTNDHCFILRRCVAMAEQILGGDADVLTRWNEDSLRWRGKAGGE